MTTKAASLIGGLLARKGEAQPLGGDPLGRASSALRAAAPQRATIDTDSPLVFAPPPRAEPRRRAWPLPLIGALLAGLVAGALYASGEPPEAPAAAGAIIAWGHGGPAGPLPVTLAGPVSWPAVAPIGEPGRTKGHAPSPEAENVAGRSGIVDELPTAAAADDLAIELVEAVPTVVADRAPGISDETGPGGDSEAAAVGIGTGTVPLPARKSGPEAPLPGHKPTLD